MFSVKRPDQASIPGLKARCLISVALISVLGVSPLFGATTREEFDAKVNATMVRLNREAGASDGMLLVGELLQVEYSAPPAELKWALEHELSWGEIAAFAYIRATTGQSFQQLDAESAGTDLWSFAEKAGMNAEKMANSLDLFLKRVERERNTRIFDRMRSNRRISRLPDLGSGFGLIQEALDFRNLESPRPTKIHNVNPGELSKGGQ